MANPRRLRMLCALLALTAGGCLAPAGEEWAQLVQAENGVPQDGFPNYQERLMLLAINRARSEPNSLAHGTSGSCGGDGSTPFAPSTPLVYDLDGSRAARFHCIHCQMNGGGLSHASYCTLEHDVATSGCDGAAACSCEPGSEHFSCTVNGGHGTDPFTRCALFGYDANGEVGALGYGDGWGAVEGWVTECPDYEGHRRILLDADQFHSRIGLGYTGGQVCEYAKLYFGDTGAGQASIPLMPSGSHRPEDSEQPTFYVHLHDPGGEPESLHVVVDGTCHAMQLDAGEDARGTYRAAVDIGPGCHLYTFLARDSAGARHVYPAAGALGAGDCSADYEPQAPEADCDTCDPGETLPCGIDEGACELGERRCVDGFFGPCEGGVQPSAEICNQLDDDCDGETDEDCVEPPGSCGCAAGPDDGSIWTLLLLLTSMLFALWKSAHHRVS
ncbi:MAG: hypothetical protein JXR96_20755 [Deltaproteobacteria bacterium]|nr:hypothetical protein [Deltaproteobacteria bacterium]